jgi:hypothetical protein
LWTFPKIFDPETHLFSKATLLAYSMIVQNFLIRQFFKEFGNIAPSVNRHVIDLRPINLRIAPLDNDRGYMHIPPPGMVRNPGARMLTRIYLAKKATYQFDWENTKYDLDNRTEVNLPRKWLLRKWLS